MARVFAPLYRCNRYSGIMTSGPFVSLAPRLPIPSLFLSYASVQIYPPPVGPFRFRRTPSIGETPSLRNWTGTGPATKNPISSTIASRHVSRLVRLISRPRSHPSESFGSWSAGMAVKKLIETYRVESFLPARWKTMTEREERIVSVDARCVIYWSVRSIESNGSMGGSRRGWVDFSQ